MTAHRLTLREKIGALVCPRIFGDRQGLDCFDFPDAVEFLRDYPPVSMIVAGGELRTTPNLLRWIGAEFLPRPPLFAADLEEGLGQQLRGGGRYLPSMAVGAARSADLARSLGEAIAQEAAAAGIRWIFAPVLDLARDPRNPVMGSRSFGADAELVESLGAAFFRGMMAGGAVPTGKHFPGHGSTPVDSHESLPTVDLPLEWLERLDLRPFRFAVSAKIPALMAGHLAVPALEPDLSRPVSLSERAIEGYLRGKLGFEGVVATDALVMGAVKGDFDPDELGLLALQAGCDLLLMPSAPLPTAQRIEEAVRLGTISEKRIDRAVSRISHLLLHASAPAPIRPVQAGLDRALARQSLTLLDEGRRFFPLQPGEEVSLQVWNEARGGEEWVAGLQNSLRAAGFALGEKGREILAVFSDNRAWRGRAGISADSELALRRRIEGARGPVLLGFCSPFAVAPFVSKCPVLLAYGGGTAAIEAAVEALSGRLTPQGQLPVKLS